MRMILKKNRIAHCDIKPANIVLLKGRLFLIDNDEVTKFGERRNIGTLEYNWTKFGLYSREIVDEKTDDMGF
jgi:serine/threonine protein kinase